MSDTCKFHFSDGSVKEFEILVSNGKDGGIMRSVETGVLWTCFHNIDDIRHMIIDPESGSRTVMEEPKNIMHPICWN